MSNCLTSLCLLGPGAQPGPGREEPCGLSVDLEHDGVQRSLHGLRGWQVLRLTPLYQGRCVGVTSGLRGGGDFGRREDTRQRRLQASVWERKESEVLHAQKWGHRVGASPPLWYRGGCLTL